MPRNTRPDNRNILSQACVGVAANLLLFLTGCAPDLYPVAGTVTFNDETPVAGAFIEFKPAADGMVARGRTDNDGHFVLQTAGKNGARPGEYQAVIAQVIVMDGMQDHLGHGPARTVPKKYADYETSGLSATLKAESNTVNFQLDLAD